MNQVINIEQIVGNVHNANSGFRAHMCERVIEAHTIGNPIPDAWIFYLLAVRLHAVPVPPEKIRQTLLDIATLIKNGN
ncbi:MAG: hypothetical protein AAB506_02245 [Patescibacteria group bacterium]